MRTFLMAVLVVSCIGTKAQSVIVKGPYLQMATSNSMMVKWETSYMTTSAVHYGTDSNLLNFTQNDTAHSVYHECTISNLQPNSRYFYSIWDSSKSLKGDGNNYFVTSPNSNDSALYRFWLTGDCGNNSINQLQVRNSYYNYIHNRVTNAWLLMGDNAYQNGLDSEYNQNFFQFYQDGIMKHCTLFPAPGNHDYANDINLQNNHQTPYYQIFQVPTKGEAGGIASNTEAFYSYDYGNIHFLSLDSYGQELNAYRLYDTLGPQVEWIKRDLDSNKKKWTIAYWHHPPYTMGSHNSDFESELISIRTNLLQILERYGVDMIFCGHSHAYERSKLMKGHYGVESSFDSTQHLLSTSSGLYNGTNNSCPYQKDAQHQSGTIYIVSGSAGSLGGNQPSYPHDAMQYSNVNDGGSIVLEIENNRADVKWLCADGIIRDSFVFIKNANKKTKINADSGQVIKLEASWKGNYNWTCGDFQTPKINVFVKSDTIFKVNDGKGCLEDQFVVHYKSRLDPIAVDTTKPIDTNILSIDNLHHQNTEFFFIDNGVLYLSSSLNHDLIKEFSIYNSLGALEYENLNGSFKNRSTNKIDFKEILKNTGIYILKYRIRDAMGSLKFLFDKN